MKTICSIALLLAVSAFGQASFSGAKLAGFSVGPPPASGGGGGAVITNFTGYPALMWYVGSDYYTNSSTPTWPDRVSSYNLTNQYSNTHWPATTTLDGVSSVLFDGAANSSTLRCETGPTNVPVWEYIMLANYIGLTNAYHYWSSYNNSNSVTLDGSDNTGHRIISGGSLSGGTIITNKWVVWDVVRNAISGPTVSYTNNVQEITSAAASGTMCNISLGGDPWQGGAYANLGVVELIIYKTNLTTALRSSAYNYFKTNYPAASLP